MFLAVRWYNHRRFYQPLCCAFRCDLAPFTPDRTRQTVAGVSFLSVKVIYSQMAEYVSTSSEYFVLENPATLRDLLNNVAVRHPSIKMMITNMWILVNGTPAKLNDPLKDGEEVDLIPLVAGG